MRDEQNSPGSPESETRGETAEVDPALQAHMDIAAMRAEYGGDPDLDESWLADGWEPLLRSWIEQATRAGIAEPNAMVLATVELTDTGPRPASRTVLCKGLSSEGVTFYTNYGSDKGRQLAAVPFASITFAWPALGRQVNLRGPVRQVAPEVTAVYWRSRPRNSQLGAWASDQSQPIASRTDLDRVLTEATARFEGVDQIPVPANWGGYLLRPDQVEFWQGRRSRLHNRIRVTLDPGTTDPAAMKLQRLQP
ncbi:pyridoxamine 5'-phosphate oxidase [Nocardia transvalensis]|uniref:pyridoxamine 5'-phosphate oxidase n=1 Tax=Nocardia transvalensis TaxID=37333 RepID=UPI001895434F|nr:pyridoxamine 5'-phosphate oxidase [Nocardia transvalensis]MBF6334204.1 pyridoxamine 5'-phosphate oxidase [Nocardia transvalensis]